MNSGDEDRKNKSLRILLDDLGRGGIKEVTDEYFISALGWKIIRRYDLPDWVKEFAERHKLIYERDKKLGRTKFIRSTL